MTVLIILVALMYLVLNTFITAVWFSDNPPQPKILVIVFLLFGLPILIVGGVALIVGTLVEIRREKHGR